MKRIVLTGPESTGKSQLTGDLAKHFGGIGLAETARSYLELLGPGYSKQDILTIAKMQVDEEKAAASKDIEYLFIDTDLIVTKIWLQHCYGDVPDWIHNSISQTPRHLHLLCYPDLPWVPDRLRENPDIRMELFDLYRSEIEFYKLPYTIITGFDKLRLQQAIDAVNAI